MTCRYNVTVPDELGDWLDNQPHLSPSGLLEKAIRDRQLTERPNIMAAAKKSLPSVTLKAELWVTSTDEMHNYHLIPEGDNHPTVITYRPEQDALIGRYDGPNITSRTNFVIEDDEIHPPYQWIHKYREMSTVSRGSDHWLSTDDWLREGAWLITQLDWNDLTVDWEPEDG